MEEKIYYVHLNGEQKGPFTLDQLRDIEIKEETMVWRSDLPNWVAAATLEELRPFFIVPPQPVVPPIEPVQPQPSHQQPYQQPQQPQYAPGSETYGHPNNNQNHVPGTYPPGWTNWLGWAIVGLVLGFFTCCLGLIFGIIATVKASQANSAAKAGDFNVAYPTNDSARTWTIVSLIVGGLGIIISFLLFVVGIIDTSIFLSAFPY